MPERHLGRSLGRYRVDALVGTGGFAWVYRAFDPDLEIPVALKVLKPQFAGDPEFEARFRREAATAARLRHPNVVTIYGVGREADAVYFAMDYLPASLAARLEVTPVLPEAAVVRIGLDVARALDYAHRNDVVHRDIKVDNILFDEHGNAVVADFGIARAAVDAARETKTNLVVGTPEYFAPEQARGRSVDGRTDLYALGVSLYRAATGRLPFQGEDWYEIARQHIETPPPPPRSLNPALSPAFDQLVLRLLAKEPGDRFQGADELVAALAALAGRERDAASAPTLTVPAVAGPRPRPPLARARRQVVAVTAVAVGAAAVVLVASRREAGPRVAGDRLTPTPPPEFTLAPLVVTAAGAARPDSSAAPLPPPRPTLRIDAPRYANVFLDGQALGTGRQVRAVAPGAHTVVALLETAAGCPTARDEQRVVAGTTGDLTTTLQPEPCGQLLLRLRGAVPNARYEITGLADDRRYEGRLPLPRPLVLPVGRYQVTVQAPGCPEYDAVVSVERDDEARPRTEYIALLCPADR